MVGCLHSHQICLVPIVGEAPELRTLLILTGLNVSCTTGGSTGNICAIGWLNTENRVAMVFSVDVLLLGG